MGDIRVGFIMHPVASGKKSETFIEVACFGRWKRLTDEASKKIFQIAYDTDNLIKDRNDE